MTQGNVDLRLRAFGSGCHISVENSDGDGEALLSLAKAELSRLESKFNAFYSPSIIGQLNQCAGDPTFVALDKEARSLFEFANALWQQSNHQFDPTLAVIQDCYKEAKSGEIAKALIAKRLGHVGWSKLEFTSKGARLPIRGMLIDLNSCMRPYAADSIRRIFLGHNVGSAMISLGNDVVTIGKQRDGANWLVGVKHPKVSGEGIARLKLNNSGYAVRGDFKRCLTYEGERFPRSISPVDGQPIPGLLCVGVMAETCLAASGAASVARVKTESTALKWLNNLGLPWFAIDRKLQCHGILKT